MKLHLNKLGLAATVVLSSLFISAQVQASALSQVIEVYDNGIAPQTISIHPGERVTWINEGENEHTLTSDSGYFGARRMLPDGHTSVRFADPGEYNYTLILNPATGSGIKGKVIVKALG